MKWSCRPYMSAAALCAQLLWAESASSAALSPHPQAIPPSKARYQHFTVEQGLSQNTVRAIWQDPGGFVWIGTEEGLNRFDGYGFVVFRHREGDASSLPSDMVTSLAPERSGKLWVGTQMGVSLFDLRTERFDERVKVRQQVMALIEDRKGTLWVGTDGDGLYALDRKASKPVHYVANPDDPDALSHNKVYALVEDKAGQLWVGTHGGGLELFDRAAGRFIHHRHEATKPSSLGHNEIWSLAEDARGNLWIGTNGAGASVLDPKRQTFRHYRPDPRNPRGLRADLVTCMFVDREKALWLGTDRWGLNRYVPESDTFITYAHDPENPESLSRNAVRAIHEDHQHNLWASTFGDGVSLLRRNGHPFTYYNGQSEGRNGLIDRAVVSFLEDRDGGLWVGTAEGGIHRFEIDTGRFRQFKLGRSTVLDLHEDQKGRFWVSTWGEGLFRFDPLSHRFTRYTKGIDDPSTRLDDQIWAIDDGKDGTLWLATDLGVVHLDVDTGRVERIRPAEGLSHDQVRAFLREDNGDLWIGSLGGLDRLRRDGTIEHLRHDRQNPKSLSHDWVMALHRDRRGRLWVATYGGGLNLYDSATRTFTAYKEDAGLPSNTIYAILEDDQGRLWLSTNKGLCRFDPEHGTSETYDVTNGLQIQQFNARSALRTRSGAMLFGTVDGFYHFDPRRITPNPHVPPLALTSLKVFNEPRKGAVAISRAEEIVLRHEDAVFSVEFAILDYTFPRRNRYQYKLEGFSDRWIHLGTKRDITFTNLDPRSYVLHLRASNSDGIWAENGRSVDIRITPPFWATWWFRTLVVGATVGLLYSVHRWRVAFHERRERELEYRVDEAMSRVKILRGLLPICSACKKVRDDQGYWSQIESYIRDRSEADFTHGLCPDCIPKFYPNSRSAKAAGES